jgi:3-(3-hydroxy-phenyl)propionate hydroxylase
VTTERPSLYFDYRPYPFVRPPELSGERVRHAVAIVGAGPVGLAVALALALYGVRSVVLEADDRESGGSRAACISRRSMEILAQLGVIEAFEAVALPWTSGTSIFRGRPIFRLTMPHSQDERFFPMANLQQNILERILLERAAASGFVEVRWLSEVTGLDRRTDGATLTVRTPEGDYALDADYVVAADGARSVVRQLMGLRLSGTSYSGRYLIADIRMRSRSPTERRAWFDSEANRGSTILMHRQPHDIWRVDYQLDEDADEAAELAPGRLAERIEAVLAMAGETAPWELDWASVYKAHCLCLDRYDHGRVLFAGDAAHLVPIFGVRGLNSGLADANNLGWKLAAVLSGEAPETLLGTYGEERRAATLEIFEEAGKSTRFMTPPSPGYALMRQAALSLSLRHAWAGALANPRQSAPHAYLRSPLNTADPAGAALSGGPAPGVSAPSVRIDDGFLHDRFGAHPVALYFCGAPDDAIRLRELAAGGSGRVMVPQVVAVGAEPPPVDGVTRVADTRSAAAAVYGAGPGAALLLRPDWHVAARTPAPGREWLADALGRVAGHG